MRSLQTYIRIVALAWIPAAAACGDDETTDTGGGTAATSTTTAGTSQVSAPGTSTTTTAGTGTATSTTTSGSTGATGSSGDPTGGGSTGGGNVVYSAEAIVGALDRVIIRKADLDNDRCTWVRIVRPGGMGQFPITTPVDWSVENGAINSDAASCMTQFPGMNEAEPATAGSGTIGFGAMGAIYPCEIDIDVSLDFAGAVAPLPTTDALVANTIVVAGC